MRKDFNLASAALASVLMANSSFAAEIPPTANDLLIDDTTGEFVTPSDFGSYLNQDGDAADNAVTVITKPTGVSLTGNTWKNLPVSNFTVTDNTYISVDYRTSDVNAAEVLGMLFLPENINPNSIYGYNSDQEKSFMRLGGADAYNGSNNAYDGSGGWQTMTFKVSDYNPVGASIGDIVFVNDDDAGGINSTVKGDFRNIFLYEASPANADIIPPTANDLLIDDTTGEFVTPSDFGSYLNQDGDAPDNAVTVITKPTGVSLTGNTWKNLPVSNFIVTGNSRISVEYRTSYVNAAEVQGMLFLPENVNPNSIYGYNSNQEKSFMRLGGADAYNGSNNAYDGSGGWQTVTFKVSDYNPVGTSIGDIVFVNDDDAGGINSTVKGDFRNIFLYEAIPNNAAPVLSGELNLSVNQGSSVVLDVLSYANDPDGDAVFPATCAGFNNGSAVISNNSTFVYTPDFDFSGSDSSACYVKDGHGAFSNGMNVNITVNPVTNQAPVIAAGQAYSMYEGEPALIVDMLSVAIDPNGDTLSAYDCYNSSGNLTVNMNVADNTCTITPKDGFSGDDTVTYYVADTSGNISNAGVVDVSVIPTSFIYNTVPSSGIAEGSCGYVSYFGPKLDDALLDDQTLYQMVDARLNGLDDIVPEGTMRSFIPMGDINFVDGKADIRLVTMKGTPAEPIGVIVGSVLPDENGGCNGYYATTNATEDKVLTEVFSPYLLITDGVNPIDKVNLSGKVAWHILENHKDKYDRILNKFSDNARVQACETSYPNASADANGDGQADQYQCLSNQIEP